MSAAESTPQVENVEVRVEGEQVVSVRPPEADLRARKNAFVRAHKCERMLGFAGIVTLAGGVIGAIATARNTERSEWIYSSNGRAAVSLGLISAIVFYGKHVAKNRMKELKHFLEKYGEFENAYDVAIGVRSDFR